MTDSSSSRGPVAGDDGHPPLFGASGTAEVDDGTTRSINLDDIFADCFLGPSPDSLPASTSSMRSTARGSSTFGVNEAYTDSQIARDRVIGGSSVEMGNSGDGNGTGGVGSRSVCPMSGLIKKRMADQDMAVTRTPTSASEEDMR